MKRAPVKRPANRRFAADWDWPSYEAVVGRAPSDILAQAWLDGLGSHGP